MSLTNILLIIIAAGIWLPVLANTVRIR